MKKAAILCVLVMMISVVPAFALTQTNNTTTSQVQNQTQTTTAQKTCDQTNCKATGDCNCDGEQHRYGQKNNAGNGDGEQHRYGQKNTNAGSGDCNGDGEQHRYGQKTVPIRVN
ncbi:hypothetical protein [Methanobacterium sp. CWC-01]|uniref:hypothetical protein n=1 Tax=Methanobacterium aridiramus TaxID=2584467 RepID=UPI002575496B|nr:hypothetical protein [Methanobacterium sp. CWC-01]